MDAPKPPFHSVTDELLYSIYLKLQTNTEGLAPNDINTLAKLNALLTDADVVSEINLSNAINLLKGNPPEAGNTMEKLFNIIQGLNYLSAEDIDTLAELNAILGDAGLVRTIDLTNAVASIVDGLKSRIVQFQFKSNQYADDALLFKGQITSLSDDFTNELFSVSYKSRLDTSDSWNVHANLAALQIWITANITGNEITGTKYWIKCIATYKQGKNGEAISLFYYSVQ